MKRGKQSKKKTAPSKKKVLKSKKVVTKKLVKKKSSVKNKRLLAISIAAFFILSFALAFVNTSRDAKVTGHDIGDFLEGDALDQNTRWADSKIANTFRGGDLDTNIAKYFIFFMLLMLITSVLNFAKFPPSKALQFFIALPVAFLASAYLVPAEVLTILQSYQALGIVLSFVLPFVILLFFSAMLTSNEKIKHMSMPKIMLEVFLWLFFAIVLGYKIISGLLLREIPLALNLPILIMGAVFLASALIFVFNKKFRNWMWKIGLDIRRAKANAARVEEHEREVTRRTMTDIEPED